VDIDGVPDMDGVLDMDELYIDGVLDMELVKEGVSFLPNK
jgi:hypothetical protein